MTRVGAAESESGVGGLGPRSPPLVGQLNKQHKAGL